MFGFASLWKGQTSGFPLWISDVRYLLDYLYWLKYLWFCSMVLISYEGEKYISDVENWDEVGIKIVFISVYCITCAVVIFRGKLWRIFIYFWRNYNVPSHQMKLSIPIKIIHLYFYRAPTKSTLSYSPTTPYTHTHPHTHTPYPTHTLIIMTPFYWDIILYTLKWFPRTLSNFMLFIKFPSILVEMIIFALICLLRALFLIQVDHQPHTDLARNPLVYSLAFSLSVIS